MVEQAAHHGIISKESEPLPPVSDVLIVYPDVRTTGGSMLTEEERSSTLAGAFYTTTERLLERYRNNGARVTGLVYADTLLQHFSPLYPPKLFDAFINIEPTFVGWTREKQSVAFREASSTLNPKGAVIVGGYHAHDCVVTMVNALRAQRYTVQPNLLLTDKLGQLLVAHRMRAASSYSDKKREEDRTWWGSQYDVFTE